MITNPSPRDALDQRLLALVDKELAARLIAEHPELYAHDHAGEAVAYQAERLLGAEPRVSAAAPRRAVRFAEALLALGLIFAMTASIIGLLFGTRHAQPASPATHAARPAAPASGRHPSVHHATPMTVARGHGLRTAGAAATQAQQAATPARKALATAQASSSPQAIRARTLETSGAPSTLPQTGARPVVRPAARSLPQLRPAQQALSATSASSASEDASPNTNDVTADDPSYPGRQIPSGPVWADNGPPGLSATPGGLILGGGSAGHPVFVPRGHASCSPSRGDFF